MAPARKCHLGSQMAFSGKMPEIPSTAWTILFGRGGHTAASASCPGAGTRLRVGERGTPPRRSEWRTQHPMCTVTRLGAAHALRGAEAVSRVRRLAGGCRSPGKMRSQPCAPAPEQGCPGGARDFWHFTRKCQLGSQMAFSGRGHCVGNFAGFGTPKWIHFVH